MAWCPHKSFHTKVLFLRRYDGYESEETKATSGDRGDFWGLPVFLFQFQHNYTKHNSSTYIFLPLHHPRFRLAVSFSPFHLIDCFESNIQQHITVTMFNPVSPFLLSLLIIRLFGPGLHLMLLLEPSCAGRWTSLHLMLLLEPSCASQ